MTMDDLRRGRYSELSDWKEQYVRKRMTPQEAVSQLRDQERISCTGGGTWPKLFDRALAERLSRRELSVTLRTLFMLERPAVLSESCVESIRFQSGFFGAERDFVGQGNVEYVPFHLGRTTEFHRQFAPRVVVMAVSPPDEDGWMSRSIWGTHITRDTFTDEQCQFLIAEVNEKLPYLCSEGSRHTMVHVSEVDAILEGDYVWPEVSSRIPAETERRLAEYIADMIPDGACLQLGFGGLADAIGSVLAGGGKKDLGLQTEVMTNSVVDLMRMGIINNRQKETCRGKSVAAALVGDRRLWDFCHKNPDICMKEIDWVNHPANIAKNSHVVSINSAMEIDLTGQVAAESIGPRQYTGTGGQLQWVVGAQWSPGGKSFLAIPSTYRDGESGELCSKIKAFLPCGSIVTTPRTCVQYVATEYGVADLRYQSVGRRVNEMIRIAHPAFREKLRYEAQKLLGYPI